MESKRSLKHQNKWHFLFPLDVPGTQELELGFQLCPDCGSPTSDLSNTVCSAVYTKGS